MTNPITLPTFHLATTSDGYMALYPSLDHLALDAGSHDFKTVAAVQIDLGAVRREDTEAARAILALFNQRESTTTSGVCDFALRLLPEEFADAALHNHCEAKRLATEERAHIVAEIDNLHTL